MDNNFRVKVPKGIFTRVIVMVSAGVITARLLLTLLPSYKVDMGGYRVWSLYLANQGYDNFYQTFHVVYGPVFMYLLHFSGLLVKFFSLSLETHEYLIKLWALLSDLVGALLIYKLGKRVGKERLGLLLSVTYTLNPAIFFNSSIWGQFDSLYATMLFGVMYLFYLRRKTAAVTLFVIAILTKPQSMALFPLIIYLFFFHDFKWGDFVSSFILGLVTYLLLILPFNSGRPIYWLISHYLKSGGDYPYATANAFNIWTLLGGQTVKDNEPFMGLTFAAWSLILLGIVVVMSFIIILHKRNQLFVWQFAAFFLTFGLFFFGSRMHERYLFSTFIFLTTLVLWDNRFLLPLVILSLCHLANQWYVYELAQRGVFWVINYDPPAVLIAFATLSVMIYTVCNYACLIWMSSPYTDQLTVRKGYRGL